MSNTCAERGYFEDNQPERDSEVHEILWLVTDCDDPRFGLAHLAPLPLLSEKKNIRFWFLVLVLVFGLGQIENGPFTWSHCTQCAFQ